MKDLIITPPEGYEVDKENSTFEKIVFKKKTTRPQSWEEFKEMKFSTPEYAMNISSEIGQIYVSRGRTDNDRNLCKTREEAEAFLALIQLRRLWHEWEDENTEHQAYEWYYYYYEDTDEWKVVTDCTILPLMFYNEENAKKFLECFKDLFDKIKILFK